MTDNTQLNPGKGGDVARAVDRGAAKTTLVLIDIGGAAGEQILGPAAPMPVAGAVTISGGVALTGTLPAFAATPTFNLGALNGAALDTSVQAIKTALGTPFQAGGSIGNTSFGAVQSGAWSVGRTWALSAAADSVTATISGTVATSGPAAVAATSTALSGVATPAGYTPTGGSQVTTGAPNLLIGPFTPQFARDIWGTISATAATGTIQLLRSINGGTPAPMTDAGYIGQNTTLSGTQANPPAVAYLWNLTGYTGQIINEPLLTASDGATYYLAINLSAGSVTYRLGQ